MTVDKPIVDSYIIGAKHSVLRLFDQEFLRNFDVVSGQGQSAEKCFKWIESHFKQAVHAAYARIINAQHIQMASLIGAKFLEIEDASERITLVYDYTSLTNATVAKELAKKNEPIMNAFNAAYDGKHNLFILGTTMLQFPAFSHTLPRFYNYGYIGGIIAHEMMHAYDIKFIRYNENGDRLPSWLPANFTKSHLSKMNLMQKMYERPLNRLGYDAQEYTKQENFADIHGIRLAYRASFVIRFTHRFRLYAIPSLNLRRLNS
ncbi:unnamed protein product [Cylicocyclus nassatus]|uniref:Peptidase M13 C-terminal domain-containing protein n=1 Tax=Cylicocyclus nassatus TaxID=53992 RepID=A0AA36H7K6_CYLNA|nr:unnamed protein product [Cylicocyclus nassatus]